MGERECRSGTLGIGGERVVLQLSNPMSEKTLSNVVFLYQYFPVAVSLLRRSWVDNLENMSKTFI